MLSPSPYRHTIRYWCTAGRPRRFFLQVSSRGRRIATPPQLAEVGKMPAVFPHELNVQALDRKTISDLRGNCDLCHRPAAPRRDNFTKLFDAKALPPRAAGTVFNAKVCDSLRQYPGPTCVRLSVLS